MIDFVGRSRSPLDDMQQWNQYFAAQDATAQQNWQNREVRNRYNDAARQNREGAISDAQFQATHADPGGVNDIPGQFAGLTHEVGDPIHVAPDVTPLGPDGVPGTAGGPASATSGSQSGLPTVDVRRDYTSVAVPTALFSDRVARNNPRVADYVRAFNQVIQGRMNPEPLKQNLDVLVRQRLITQAQANQHYTNVLDYLRAHRDPNTLSGDLSRNIAGSTPAVTVGPNGEVTPTGRQPGMPSATVAIPPASPGTAAATAAGVDLGAPANLVDNPVLNPDTHVGGLEPPTGYQGSNDTTRGLVPTREMRMMQSTIQDSLRRADIAARHGDRAGAQAAFAQALQGQAAYLSQSRQVLFRAAAAGSLGAMETLIGEFNGYPAGSIRLQPTDERRTRFVRQVRRQDGTWVSADETPHTRNELLDGLQNLIDAEGAQARTEAYNEEIRARITAGAQITVAAIHYREQLVQSLTQAEIAAMDSRTKLALQRGEGQLLIDSQNGGAYLRYTIQDANGNNVPVTDVIRRQTVPTPDTEGHRTTQMDVRTRVTGTGNTTPGANQ